ncbi:MULTISPECIES: hypothetical protein [Halorussus]|uniref:hypothetical protein n=1 Tax=Halorussus TaxID=1070314 RepID=UPI0013B3AAB8|nr:MULTISPECIES: hypothetical protein [Halorussus]NHN58947.1 hypothetical protein [Halorussus sp. JP-T4]
MEAEALDKWIDRRRPPLDSLLLHRFLKPPHGYAIGIGVWPVYLAFWYGTVFAAEILGPVPFSLSVIAAVGGLLATSVVSALAVCITAWRTPYARIRGHSLGISVFLLFALPLAYVYFGSPPLLPGPYSAIEPLGLNVFVEHALITTGLLGPAIGFAFLFFALLVLAFRWRLERGP